MFVALSRSLTKIAPVLIRFSVFRFASGGAEDRHSRTESRHDSVVCAVEGISLFHPAISSGPEIPLGVEASTGYI
jgi:hypothetical protein